MTINPKTLDLLALPSVPLADRKKLPPIPAVYFAIADDEVQYIGCSVNIRQRWVNHHRAKHLKENTIIAYLENINPSLLLSTEKALIEWFNPRLNGVVIRNGAIIRLLKPKEKQTSQRAVLCIRPFWKEGMTVQKVAKDLGLNMKSVANLRRGTEKGDWATLLNCSRYFGVPLKSLIQVEEDQA